MALPPGSRIETLTPIVAPHFDSGGAHVSVRAEGAAGDGRVVGGVLQGTDDLAAFEAAYLKAVTLGVPLFIDPLPAGWFYRLSDTLNVIHGEARIYGGGVRSLICIANASGASAIQISGAMHAEIAHIGVTGIGGSGHGIVVTDGSHRCEIASVWVGWVDGDGIRLESGVSTRLNHVVLDQNNGFDPGSLGGAVRGNIDVGINVRPHPSGWTTDVRCVNCSIDAGAGDDDSYALMVGDAVAPNTVDSFQWIGGLIQGPQRLVYMRARSSALHGVYIEPPAVPNPHHVVHLDRCNSVSMSDGVIMGDSLIESSSHVTFRALRAGGFHFDAGCSANRIEDVDYGNITTGPVAGRIRDDSGTLVATNTRNSSNDRMSRGQNAQQEIFRTNMDDWHVGVPCAMNTYGGVPIAQEATIKRSGSLSARLTIASDLTQGLQFFPQPNDQLVGQWVTVEAWAYSTTGQAYLGALFLGSGASVAAESFRQNVWERLQVSFYVMPGVDTGIALRFTGTTGIVYFDSIRVWAERLTSRGEVALDTTATPDLRDYVSTLDTHPILTVAASGTAVTNFLGAQVGVPFTLRFTGSRSIAQNANINLQGSASFGGTDGAMLTLVLGSDGVFREISRRTP